MIENKNVVFLNENDGVSFDEITLGDNDQLSAMIAELMGIKTLLMLSTPNGLYDRDPEDKEAVHFPLVEYDLRFDKIKMITKSSAGRGGMKTKVQAIRKLTPLGFNVILSSFKNKRPLLAPLTQEIGTLFLGKQGDISKHKNTWLLTRLKNGNGVTIDQGAFDAISRQSSLLPVGITSIIGKFNRGDCIEIIFKKKVCAIGISEFSHSEIQKIKGRDTKSIQNLLPAGAISKVAIHKNNLLHEKNL